MTAAPTRDRKAELRRAVGKMSLPQIEAEIERLRLAGVYRGADVMILRMARNARKG